MTDAALYLARLRERYEVDKSGRSYAAMKLLSEIVKAAEEAKLQVEGGRATLISLGAASVTITADEGVVVIDGKPFAGVNYYPLGTTQVFKGPEGEPAVDVLAVEIGRILEEKIKKLNASPVPDGD